MAQVLAKPRCCRVLPLLATVIAFFLLGSIKSGNGRLGLDGRCQVVVESCPGRRRDGSRVSRRAPGVGGCRRDRSAFRRGLTVQQGLLRLVAFPGVCIFMLIGSLRCVCC